MFRKLMIALCVAAILVAIALVLSASIQSQMLDFDSRQMWPFGLDIGWHIGGGLVLAFAAAGVALCLRE